MLCRCCHSPLDQVFVDLGRQPSANRFLGPDQLAKPKPAYPLRAYVCSVCHLVQLADEHGAEEVFDGDYVYYSSTSASFVAQARAYAKAMVERFRLGARSFVMEVASNDGYLLQHFVPFGIPALGVDPAAGCAEVARGKGVETLVAFFGRETAETVRRDRGLADLIVANNVMAHVPDLHDFVTGFATLLKPQGILTLEFPHVARLIEGCQFDTIYDEHFSYLSLGPVGRILADHGLEVFDIEELATHGGSLRLFVGRQGCHAVTQSVAKVVAFEAEIGLADNAVYQGFQKRVDKIRQQFLDFLAEEARAGRSVAGFGAAAKGNTFLNYCGAGSETLLFVADDTPAKQGKFLPGSRIPVHDRSALSRAKPDSIVILPWNFRAEIVRSLRPEIEWPCRFVSFIPELLID